MLGIIIGVASVVIMVSVVQGSNRKTMEYYEKLGDNKISVNIYGTPPERKAVAPAETRRCQDNCLPPSYLQNGKMIQDRSRKQEWIKGVTPQGYVSSPILSGVKNTDNMPQGSPKDSICTLRHYSHIVHGIFRISIFRFVDANHGKGIPSDCHLSKWPFAPLEQRRAEPQ